MPCFKEDLPWLDIEYSGSGHEIARQFYIPVLKASQRYDRISGYFSVDSLSVVSAGLAGLIRNRGRVRLIMGLHDLGPQLREAYIISRDQAEKLVREIGERIAQGLDTIEDVFERRRLEALAWMMAEGLMEIKVAVPKRVLTGLGNGIFHMKRLILYDEDGCIISADGSANETRRAWEENGENLTIHMSWREGSLEYINRHQDRFDALWCDRNPEYNVFSLPEAVERKLRERYYPETPPDSDPAETLKPVARGVKFDECGRLYAASQLVLHMGKLRSLAHLGLGPVRLYPHQVYAAEFPLKKFPHRALMADEVGLGKTIEVGAVVKRLMDQGSVSRVLVLAPKNVARQWQEEMTYHFNLPFYRLELGPKRLVGPDGNQVHLQDENPFDQGGIDLLVASWHYARGSSTRRSELLDAKKFFDLVVVDEAHAARRVRSLRSNSPTLLNLLCSELSIRSPHLLLVTATPVQLDELEAWDLLRILGLGGPWAHESNFKRFYGLLREDSDDVGEYLSAFGLAAWVGRSYLTEDELERLIRSVVRDPVDASEVLSAIRMDGDGATVVSRMHRRDREELRGLLVSLSPVQWFMVRNNRERLQSMGYRFPERIPDEVAVALEPRHRDLLDRLDNYLRRFYGLYERVSSDVHRGKYGFVRSIYHQRFVSSFTAAYLTVVNRMRFLRALQSGDVEALRVLASQLLDEEDWEDDEEALVEAALDLMQDTETAEAVHRELGELESLKALLQRYSPEAQSGDDPKLRAVTDKVDELVGHGRRVLVFSKYVDTVEAVVRYLAAHSRVLSRLDVGVYTGAGGRLYVASGGEVSVGKEGVRAALDEGRIRVLVCSDAASEGLNLQSASAVVNVDMPWNPSRVEQRIGRVDRLGQRAESVEVWNVWYPDTVEAEVYRRLFKRNQTYRLVVGPAQQIISGALRLALDEGLSGARLVEMVEETLRRVDEVKLADFNVLAGSSYLGGAGDDDRVVRALAEYCVRAAEALGMKAEVAEDRLVVESPGFPGELEGWNGASLKAGEANALTAAHPLVLWLARSVAEAGGGAGGGFGDSLYVLYGYDGLGELYRVGELAPEKVDGSERLVGLLTELMGGYGREV